MQFLKAGQLRKVRKSLVIDWATAEVQTLQLLKLRQGEASPAPVILLSSHSKNFHFLELRQPLESGIGDNRILAAAVIEADVSKRRTDAESGDGVVRGFGALQVDTGQAGNRRDHLTGPNPERGRKSSSLHRMEGIPLSQAFPRFLV